MFLRVPLKFKNKIYRLNEFKWDDIEIKNYIL